MNISLVSDLHLECGYQELPGGDVLILAGDICEARTLRKEFHSTKNLYRMSGSFPSADFFEFECAKYKKVFMVMGNHEHYHGKLHKTWHELVSMLPDNVTLLEDQCEEYEGVLFVGSTLWTDLNKGDPLTMQVIKDFMTDYKCIQNFYPSKSLYHKLTPQHTYEVHRKSMQYIKLVVEQNKDKPIVVITHMAPSFASVNERYKHDTLTNGGYASELSEFILDHPQIKTWVHGHMHDPVDYMIGTTRIVSNPRGYNGYENTSQFRPDFTFTV
jgi:Icc-related predicted phosphoesterase